MKKRIILFMVILNLAVLAIFTTVSFMLANFEYNRITKSTLPFSVMQELIMSMIPFIIILIILLIIISLIFSSVFTKKLVKYFESFAKSLRETIRDKDKSLKTGEYYEEFYLIIQDFKELSEELSNNINQIKNEKQKIEDIISNMKEGILFVDNNFIILLKNEIVAEMLSFPTGATDNNFLMLCRNIELQDAVKGEMQNETETIVNYVTNDKVYMAFISYVKSGGVVLLINDVTELMRLEGVKRELFENVTHELKTPLTSIRGFSELIAEDMVKDKADIKKYSKLILDESNRLIYLINDILMLSDFENAKTIHDTSEISLRAEFEKELAILENQIKEKNLSVEIVGDARVEASEDLISIVIQNIFDNAVKYNVQDGSIKIEIERFTETGKTRFAVSDTGIGIEEKDQEKVFERFYRVDKSRSKKAGGTGLGLAIVKHAVSNLDGTISIKSAPDEGTAITVTL